MVCQRELSILHSTRCKIIKYLVNEIRGSKKSLSERHINSPSSGKQCVYEHKKCIYSEERSKIQTNVLFLVLERGLREVFSLLNYAEINSFFRTRPRFAV